MPPSLSLHFLGTASAVPSSTRNHSSLALRVDGDVWLFDVGEATQHQIQRSRGVKMGRIKRIFITHLHGDHVFGLAPLLASVMNGAGGTVGDEPDPRLEQTKDPSLPPLEIYGPPGLRSYIRAALYYTHTLLGAPYIVHELHFHPSSPVQPIVTNLPRRESESEGHDIPAHEDGTWPAFARIGTFTLSAAPIQHSVPCIGYALQEDPLPGTIVPAQYIPHLKRNASALGLKNPVSLLAKIQAGETLRMPDGTELAPPPTRPGRKIVILGDTYDPSAILPFAHGADFLVHECTNAYIPELDPPPATTSTVQAKAISHGHSTPDMAGLFARACNAKTLVLNHFSPRYKPEDEAVMQEIRRLAGDAFGKEGYVICAEDFMEVEIKPGELREVPSGEAIRRQILESAVSVPAWRSTIS